MFHAHRHAHRKTSAALLTSIALITCALLGSSRVALAQSSPELKNGGATNKQALVGSWLETVTFPAEVGRPPIQSLGTFHDDGTMVCSDQGSVTITDQPGVFTSCHGVWTHLAKRTFAYTSLELISDLSGNLVGYLKVRGTYHVAPSGNRYTGTSSAQIVDLEGLVLFAVDVTNEGRRIQIDLP